jgi:osmoprotectant transport system ATP-binding protein
MNKVIEFRNVSKSYDGINNVIDKLDLTVLKGELFAVLGPSGCGKTTLLKMVNKLIVPDSGTILVNNTDILSLNTIKLRRSIGYVIQHIGLLPHLTIKENITYVLTLMKVDPYLKEIKAIELIKTVGLSPDFLKRYPHQLSGGQKQRIGVARALAADPRIILMDEPFGAVDEISRSLLQDELLRIQKKINRTIVFVTHDIQEAFKLGSRIALINNGKIEQIGTKEELIFNPTNTFVKNFFGIKGFKATLDNEVITEIYSRILSGKESLNSLYTKLNL